MNAKTVRYILIAVLIIGWLKAEALFAFDHGSFDQVLKNYVNRQGRVDYNGIAADQRFKAYIKALKTARLDALSRDGQLAFWINAYNAVTIDKVVKWKPKKSVRETLVPGVWTGTRFFTSRQHMVAGRQVSQDDIEHDILRKEFRDPRIHFAIICASSSCPPLPQFAYTAEIVQAKLESETRDYINSPRGTQIDAAEHTLYLSKLFDWFSSDFEQHSGSVRNFLKPYLNEQTRGFLNRDPKIAYIHYDWALNAQAPLK